MNTGFPVQAVHMLISACCELLSYKMLQSQVRRNMNSGACVQLNHLPFVTKLFFQKNRKNILDLKIELF